MKNPESSDGQIYKSFTPEQQQELAIPSYKIKKEKREAKKLDTTPPKDSEALVDPATVSVIGAVDEQGAVKSPSVAPPEKKLQKEKSSSSVKSSMPSQSKTSMDVKIAELDQKWSDSTA